MHPESDVKNGLFYHINSKMLAALIHDDRRILTGYSYYNL